MISSDRKSFAGRNHYVQYRTDTVRFAVNTSMLLLTYGIIGGLGLGMAYGCTISTAVKYFPDKRGLIGGVTTAVYGLSSVIVSPIITIIVEKRMRRLRLKESEWYF